MKKIFGILLVACVVLSGAAFADSISGKVVAVDQAAGTIEVAKTDPATGAVENVKVAVDAATIFTGVASLAEVQADQDATIEASADAATGVWKASSVDVMGPVPVPPALEAPAEEAPAAI